ncbi:MAG: diaminobutyrate acetyltransferase [Nitrospinae bacterium]|nr:diaminobutyrate acetyltransferase [Nitrospinota bacterium]
MIEFRHPNFNEGLGIYYLVKKCPSLDLNSIYFYYLLCKDFFNTCVVATYEGQLIGFLSAYRKPHNPLSLFVQQIVVLDNKKEIDLEMQMLSWLYKKLNPITMKEIETTVSTSNKVSEKLFKQFAFNKGFLVKKSVFLKESQFGEGIHEQEILYTLTKMRKEYENV